MHEEVTKNFLSISLIYIISAGSAALALSVSCALSLAEISSTTKNPISLLYLLLCFLNLFITLSFTFSSWFPPPISFIVLFPTLHCSILYWIKFWDNLEFIEQSKKKLFMQKKYMPEWDALLLYGLVSWKQIPKLKYKYGLEQEFFNMADSPILGFLDFEF